MLSVWEKFFGKVRESEKQAFAVEKALMQEIAGITWWSGPMVGQAVRKWKQRFYHIINLISKSLPISNGNSKTPDNTPYI